MKILIVEDDRTLNDGIALSLGRENVKQTGENSAMSAAFNLQKDKEQNAEEWAEAYCNTAHKERARGAAEY